METVVLDPVEVASDRTEFNLTKFIAQAGPDWGDAEIQSYMAEAERGQLPVDFRFPNRTIQIPLLLLERDGQNFEEVRQAIQAKAALFQREGGSLKRATSAGTWYADIVSASMKPGGSTLAALGYVDADATLTLECVPDFYGDEQIESDHVVTTNPELIAVETDIAGDHPGRVKITVDEDQGKDQRGLLLAIRSRHYSSAATAASVYTAQSRTPLDTAANATVASRSVVRHQNLGTDWTPVLSTQAVSAGAHLTHTGTYRIFAELYSVSAAPPQARLVWDVGDLTLPSENAPWQIPGANNWYIADLGEVRLDEVPTGLHRWQGVIQGKGASGGESISIYRLWILNADECFLRLSAPLSVSVGATGYTARDEFNQSAGNATGKTLAVGGTYTGAGDADDFTINATDHVAERTAVSDADLRTGRYLIAGTSALTDTLVQADVSSDHWTNGDFFRWGVLARYTDTNNWVMGVFRNDPAGRGVTVRVSVIKRVAGTETVLNSGGALSLHALTTIRLLVTATGGFHAWAGAPGANLGNPLVSGSDSALATGGALASGKVGMYDARTSATAATRQYNNLVAYAPNTDAVIFANQSVELRHDGVYREDATGSASGLLIPTGNLPRLPPSGLEGRSVEVFIKASRGDLDQLPDTDIDDISARISYRPSWLTVPGS